MGAPGGGDVRRRAPAHVAISALDGPGACGAGDAPWPPLARALTGHLVAQGADQPREATAQCDCTLSRTQGQRAALNPGAGRGSRGGDTRYQRIQGVGCRRPQGGFVDQVPGPGGEISLGDSTRTPEDKARMRRSVGVRAEKRT